MEKNNWNYKVFVLGDLNENVFNFKGVDKEMWIGNIYIDEGEYTIDEFNKEVAKGVNATIEIAKQYLAEYNNGDYKNWTGNVVEVEIDTYNDTPVYVNQKHLATWLTNYFKMHKEEIGFNRPIQFFEYGGERTGRVLLLVA